MSTAPRHNISAERALDLLSDGQPLENVYVVGEFKIETTDNWEQELVIENSIIESFSGTVTQFLKPVRLTNSHFKKCQFLFSYFAGGLTIDNCTFDDYLDFQAGGHNTPENLISITNNHFADFVNFFDCWYEGPIEVKNNKFQKGTNIASEKQLITFNIPPTIENNIGDIKIEGELPETEPTSTNTVNNIIKFLTELAGTDDIQPDSDILVDVGMGGDDFHEMIEKYSKLYSVDMTNYLWYFHADEEGNNFIGGSFFKPPYERVTRIPITPNILTDFANKGKWEIDYPPHTLPKRRYDLIINSLFLLILVIIFIVWLADKVFG